MRQNLVTHGGVTFLEDCYNASPDSMRAALDVLARRTPGPGGRRIALLGDMLELGAASEQAHRETGALAAGVADLVVATGPRQRRAGRCRPCGRRNRALLPKSAGSSRISKV